MFKQNVYFYQQSIFLHCQINKNSCWLYPQIWPSVEHLCQKHHDYIQVCWSIPTGLVCMKSSTSVVELVMLLCSQVSFDLSLPLHNLLLSSVFIFFSMTHPLCFSQWTLPLSTMVNSIAYFHSMWTSVRSWFCLSLKINVTLHTVSAKVCVTV